MPASRLSGRPQAEAQAQRDRGPRGQAPRRLGAARPTEREAILADVKAENPGLSRWKNMLEPLCLAALEARLRQERVGASQPLLFPDAESAGLSPAARVQFWQIAVPVARSLAGQLGIPRPAPVARVVQDHRGDDRPEQVVDDLGSVLAHVDGVEPELLVHLLLDREHPLDPPGLAGFDRGVRDP